MDAHTKQRRPDAGRRVFPLSLCQQVLWDWMRSGAAPTGFNTALSMSCPAQLDIPRLRKALLLVRERHHALQMTLSRSSSGVVQQRSDQLLDPLTVVCADKAIPDLIEDYVHEDVSIITGPVFSALLILAGASRPILVVRVHHLYCDGHAIAIVGREISAFYNHPSPDVRRPLQLGTFAIAEGRARGERLAPPSPGLPVHELSTVETVLNRDFLDQLRQRARLEHTTLFVLILTALARTLRRHRTEWNGRIGVVISSRSSPRDFSMVGPLLRILSLTVPRQQRGGLENDIADCSDCLFDVLSTLDDGQLSPSMWSYDDPLLDFVDTRAFDGDWGGFDRLAVPSRLDKLPFPFGILAVASEAGLQIKLCSSPSTVSTGNAESLLSGVTQALGALASCQRE